MVSRDKVTQTKATAERLFNVFVSGLCCRWQSLMHQRHIWTVFGSWLMPSLDSCCDSWQVWWCGDGKSTNWPCQCTTCFVMGDCKLTIPTVSPIQFSPTLICLSAETFWTFIATLKLLFKSGQLCYNVQTQHSDQITRLFRLWLSMFSSGRACVFLRGVLTSVSELCL